MSHDYKLDAEKARLEDKVKARYEPGPMRPQLNEVLYHKKASYDPSPLHTQTHHHDSPAGSNALLKLQWRFYAGMGETDFYDATDDEKTAAKALLSDGVLVKTFEYGSYYNKATQIKHFDDVNFGLDENGGIVIFELVKWLPEPDRPDLVIRPDEKYDAVIKRLKSRMDTTLHNHAALVDETPLQLKGGPLVKPVVTDPNRVRIMMRQRGLDV